MRLAQTDLLVRVRHDTVPSKHTCDVLETWILVCLLGEKTGENLIKCRREV